MRQDGGAALKVTVRLAATLREHVGGAHAVDVEVDAPATVASVLDALASAHPAVGRRVRDEAGGLRTHVNVFVDQDNAKDLDHLATPVPEGAEVAVLAAVSGG